MSETSIGAANGAENHSNFASKGNGAAGPHTTAATQPSNQIPPFEFTLITADQNMLALSKELYISRNGSIEKKQNGLLIAGSAKHVVCKDLRDFIEILRTATSHQALTLGVVNSDLRGYSDELRVASKHHQATKEPDAVTKTGGVFVAPDGPGLMLLDHDLKGQPEGLTCSLSELAGIEPYTGVRKFLQRVFPELKNAAFVTRPSTSSGLYNSETGEVFPESGGTHNFIVVKDASDVARAVKDCARRLILRDFGWAVVNKGGGIDIRTIVDRSVGGAERLIYEGSPILSAPLKQHTNVREPLLSPGGAVDTLKAFPPLTDAEKEKYHAICERLKESVAYEAKRVRDKLAEKAMPAIMRKMSCTETEARAFFELRYSGILGPAEVLYFDDRSTFTVGDVLEDPQSFHSKSLRDPIDPGDGRGKAMIFNNEGGDVIINSFAHGGRYFRLFDVAALFDCLDDPTPIEHDTFEEDYAFTEYKYLTHDAAPPDDEDPPIPGFYSDGDKPPEPAATLVEQLLPSEGLTFIGGQSGAGKSFVAVELALCLASGVPFFGREVNERCGVIYVAAEGFATLHPRLAAAKIPKMAAGEIFPIDIVKNVLDLTLAPNRNAFIKNVKRAAARMQRRHNIRVGAVIFDTLAASCSMKNENDSAEIQRLCTGLTEIGDSINAATIILHHYGKDQNAGLRGTSALRGAGESVLAVTADRIELLGRVKNRKLTHVKSRTDREGDSWGFDLKTERLGDKPNGKPWNVARIEVGEYTPADGEWDDDDDVTTEASGRREPEEEEGTDTIKRSILLAIYREPNKTRSHYLKATGLPKSSFYRKFDSLGRLLVKNELNDTYTLSKKTKKDIENSMTNCKEEPS